MELKEYREVYNSMVLDKEADKRILDGIKKKGEKTMKKKYYRPVWKAGRIAAAVIAVIIAGSAAVYAATEMWNNYVAEDFKVSDKPEVKNQMSDKGFSQYMEEDAGDKTNFSVEKKGVTVNVVQTLADRHCAFIYLEAEFDSKYKAVGDNVEYLDGKPESNVAYPNITFEFNGHPVDSSGRIYKVINKNKIAYSYHIINPDKTESLGDADFSIKIDRFESDKERNDVNPAVVVKGKWDFKWKLSMGTERRIYSINKKVNIKGVDLIIKELEISPLSHSLVVEEDGWNEKQRKKFEKLQRNGGLIGRFIDNIKLKKSDFIGFDGMGLSSMERDETGKIVMWEFSQFSEVLDLEKITGIDCQGNKISLKDCNYEVIK